MRITEIYGGEHIPVSYEIFPPKGDLPVDEARTVLSGLAELDPAFVSVTYSAGGSGNSERTVQIADMGQRELGLTMMAHLTCAGATKADMRRNIRSLKDHNIENVLALRGDLGPRPSGQGLPLREGSDSPAAPRGFLRGSGRLSRRSCRLHRPA